MLAESKRVTTENKRMTTERKRVTTENKRMTTESKPTTTEFRSMAPEFKAMAKSKKARFGRCNTFHPQLLLHMTLVAGLAFSVLIGEAQSLNLELCNSALGMESGDILDEQLSASSSYEVSVTGPPSARLNVEHLGGAWCPKGMVGERNAKHYLQIDLKRPHVISAVVTQGRFGNGRGVEFVEEFYLEFWRPRLDDWKAYKLYNGSRIIKGNTNTYTAVRRALMPPIHATRIRFVPHATYPRTACMRVELVGCLYVDGVLSYSVPQGEDRGFDFALTDASYDGSADGTELRGGVGQLTDGVIGDHNFRTNLTRGKGYEWIGWKIKSVRPIEIVFEFDQMRNFTAMSLYTNNMFSKEVQVFSQARVWFGPEGEGSQFNPRPVEYFYMRDDVSEYARNVSIPLRGRVGHYLKLHLYFASKWIMLSEVFFVSSHVDHTRRWNGGLFSTFEDIGEEEGDGLLEGEELNRTAPNGVRAPNSRMNRERNESENRQQIIAIIIGILVAVILVLIGAIFFFFWKTKKYKMSCLPPPLFNGPFAGAKHEIVRLKLANRINDGDLLKNVLQSEPFQVAYRGSSSYSTATTQRATASFQLASVVDYVGYGSGDYSVPHTLEATDYDSVPSPAKSHSSNALFSSFVGDIFENPEDDQSTMRSLLPQYRSDNEALDLYNSVMEVGDLKALYYEEYDKDGDEDTHSYFPPEISKENFRIVRKLGEGDFGEVHLGEMELDGNKQLIAIKSLKVEPIPEVRENFEREVVVLSRLRDPNIVRIMGTCTTEGPLCVLVEFCENGDLNQFLQGHVASSITQNKGLSATAISYGCLVYIATQVASGMKYLESLNFVHRDLATRNCLVAANYVIKICDLGVSRQLYRKDYFVGETGLLLPVRWMAWESILLGKYTTKSDVWSFSVTLWEILTLAREQPFEDLSDEQVIENARLFYESGLKKDTLAQPGNCPKEIYDLMKECWRKNEIDRPSFHEIHMFLQRKNLGYAPSPEPQNEGWANSRLHKFPKECGTRKNILSLM